MKNWNLKTFIGIAIGLTLGMVLYDYFSHDSIGWIRAIFAGVLAIVFIYIVKKIS